MSRVSYRIACAADRMTAKRLGRDRKDDAEMDEEWDLERAQAVEDALTSEVEARMESRAERKRIEREDARA